MDKTIKLKDSLGKIGALFKFKKEEEKEEEKEGVKRPMVRLNLFLLSAAFNKIQKGGAKKPLSFFTTEILNSKSKHFQTLIKQAEVVCSKQDIELFSYKAFYSQNHFALRRAVQWKFGKYIKTKQEAAALINKMKESTPDAFKRHLVTLLKEENLSLEEIEKEAKLLESEYTWHHGSAPATSVCPL